MYSPTDSFVQGDTEAHWCFVDNGPAAADISDKVYLGPSWYPQPLVRAMLQYKEIKRHWGFVPPGLCRRTPSSACK